MLVTECLSKELFKGKTVFVTGGGSGINLGVAKNFAALGAKVAICGRTQERLDAAAAELSGLGAKVCPVVADVRDFAALQRAFVKSREELGSMDVLVCGAAGNFLVAAESLSPNGFKTVIEIDDQCTAGEGGFGCWTSGPGCFAACGISVIRGGEGGMYGTHDLLNTSLSNFWST